MTNPPQILDPAGHVTVSLRCLKCQYNLRSLHKDALCPECATPVAHSLETSPLAFAPARWLTTVSRGVRLLYFAAWAYPASLAIVLLSVLVGGIVGSLRGIAAAVAWGGPALLVAALVASIVGFVLITIDSPATIINQYPYRRQTIRNGVLVSCLSIPMLVGCVALSADPYALAVALPVVTLSWVLTWGVAVKYIADFFTTPRGGDETLARLAVWSGRASAIALANTTGLAAISWMFDASGVQVGLALTGALAIIAAAVGLVFAVVGLIMTIGTLKSYARCLSILAADARMREEQDAA